MVVDTPVPVPASKRPDVDDRRNGNDNGNDDVDAGDSSGGEEIENVHRWWTFCFKFFFFYFLRSRSPFVVQWLTGDEQLYRLLL